MAGFFLPFRSQFLHPQGLTDLMGGEGEVQCQGWASKNGWPKSPSPGRPVVPNHFDTRDLFPGASQAVPVVKNLLTSDMGSVPG